MGISEWLQEINKDLDAANEKLIRKIYQNDPVKLQEALDKHRRRSAALSAAPPEIDISLMTDAELEDLREHIKLEIEHLEQQAVKFKNMMDQTKQRQSQYSSGQGGFWSLLGSALTDAIGNAGLIEEAILEKKKLLVRVENKLKKPAPTPQPQLQPNPAGFDNLFWPPCDHQKWPPYKRQPATLNQLARKAEKEELAWKGEPKWNCLSRSDGNIATGWGPSKEWRRSSASTGGW